MRRLFSWRRRTVLRVVSAVLLLAVLSVTLVSCHYDCVDCHDKGEVKCSFCNGKGEKRCTMCSGTGRRICSLCGGSGSRTCYSCGGAGSRYEYDFFSKRYVYRTCYSCVGGRTSCVAYTLCGCVDGKAQCAVCGADGVRPCPSCGEE